MLKMTMKDVFGLRAKAHLGNLVRYCRLLGTPLTEVERAYMNRRIAEERTELQRWLRCVTVEIFKDHDHWRG